MPAAGHQSLRCIASSYDGFTPGRRYYVVRIRDGFPIVIDDWKQHTAAGGLNGVFISAADLAAARTTAA